MRTQSVSLLRFLAGVAVAQLVRPAPVAAQTSLLEVAKGANTLMQVNDDGGLLATAQGAGAIPASGPGIRMMWFPSKFAFRVGVVEGNYWDLSNIGAGSFATGINTIARGDYSTATGALSVASAFGSVAMGDRATASGDNSIALGEEAVASGPVSFATGFKTRASGEVSTALGLGTTASGRGSTAMGNGTTASGNESTAMGLETKAIGLRATAMGYRTTAAGEQSTVMGSDAGTLPGGRGTFIYGDASTTTALVSFTPNEFVVRAAGGFRLRTSPTLNTGCDLPAGSGTFSCTSSRSAKEGFEDLDGEMVLDRLGAMRIQRWRYRGTNSFHAGPTAEDFHAAFGLGEGPATISTVDADGISLIAVQALERRTAELMQQNAALQTQLEELRRIVIENRRVAP